MNILFHDSFSYCKGCLYEICLKYKDCLGIEKRRFSPQKFGLTYIK